MMDRIANAGILVSSEHASWVLPESMPDLGIDDATLKAHVSWDPGASDLAAEIAKLLGAACLLGDHSRLVADLNRSPENPQVVPEVAFGVAVPGNRGLSDQQRAERIAKYHKPYWDEAERQIAAITLERGHCLHIAVHSFTPELDPPNRCFDIGLLYDPGHELEKVLAERLFLKLTRAGMRVEHNRPYSGLADGLTTALRNRLAQDRYTSMEIEINQGSMRGDWVNRVAEAIVGGLK